MSKASREQRKRTTTTMRLPNDLLRRLDAAAKVENRSRTNLAEQLLSESLNRREKKAASHGVLG